MGETGNYCSRRRSGEQGFSIIEVLIAMMVLTFGLVSLVGISIYISRANSISNTISVLATTGQDEIDQLRSAIWTIDSDSDARIAPGGDLSSNVANHFVTKTNTPVGDLIIRWKVESGPGATGDVRTVTVKVVQAIPHRSLTDGYSITTIINRN